MSKKDDKNRVRIQTVLHRLHIREADAIQAYETAIHKDGLSIRDAIREAFIAYGKLRDAGWQPQSLPTQVSMTDEMYQMFRGMQSLMKRMSELDFTGVRSVSGGDVDVEAIQRDLNAFERNSMNILGTVKSYDDED